MTAKSNVRFGQRIPVPPTVQILRDFRAFSEEREAREQWAAGEGLPLTASWDDIIASRTARAAAADLDRPACHF